MKEKVDENNDVASFLAPKLLQTTVSTAKDDEGGNRGGSSGRIVQLTQQSVLKIGGQGRTRRRTCKDGEDCGDDSVDNYRCEEV